MFAYNTEQLDRYFSLISLTNWKTLLDHDVHGFFDQMIKGQLAHITYNTLSLHYMADKVVTLDPELLFDKIVDRERGGYCFELNVLLIHVIRSLGFEAMAVGCRMREKNSTSEGIDRWRTTSHMAIVVLIHGERFLVDVGCGLKSPATPLRLQSGLDAESGLTGQTLRMDLKPLAPTAVSQPVWIYSMRFGGEDASWMEVYAFADAEYLPSDFDVLNYYTVHASALTRIVAVQSLFFEDGASGTLSLVNANVTRNISGEDEPVTVLQSERERAEALERYFGIKLSSEELDAMKGSAYALPISD
ncbi:arylamine N-acetyltransferase 1 [Cordyceps fumosorosea ARSEF 2679]|uniref:Arylamine N-acetyltransferase 1 n=1 Tax=Cordyceps fumosorosea (strain ARSEF 2679) TaxID=1081104 RepID=A0A162JDQ8_CORFA|nr:arylamine N-acetyltransferase 1 [Cordyceps fumosorosea ARSEF 2679]OAA67442.1 arylamine N-acetyltransferase 1 [Cordyceps fumosorosea ARSEF 2679]